jgi:hypothetical protein
MVERPDCRRFFCDLCGWVVYVCSWCDRGQRYCSAVCSVSARSRKRLEAGRRYQASRQGRRMHAARQARYRQRRRERLEKVTHQGCPEGAEAGIVAACVSEPEASPPEVDSSESPTSEPRREPMSWSGRCAFCAERCVPLVRHDFLRLRRPRGRLDRRILRERGDDPSRARGANSPAVRG